MIDPETESYAVGDVVKKTPFYESQYPTWTATEGTVASVKKSKVRDTELGKDERPLFRSRYGLQKEYPIFGLMVSINGVEYLVSQLGFNKDGT